MPDRKKSGFAAAAGVLTLIVVVAGLAAGVVGLQTSKLLGSKASSGCTIVQTDQGPGCWCASDGWKGHCAVGQTRNDPPSDQCINWCSDQNTDDTDNNTPKADKCDKGKVGGPCSGQYQYACGGDGCKAECNNYPKHGRWVLTGNKNCGKPGDIKPKPTGAPTPTPTRRATNCSINVTFSNPSVVCGADSITSTHKANVTWNGNSCSSRNVALYFNHLPGRKVDFSLSNGSGSREYVYPRDEIETAAIPEFGRCDVRLYAVTCNSRNGPCSSTNYLNIFYQQLEFTPSCYGDKQLCGVQ